MLMEIAAGRVSKRQQRHWDTPNHVLWNNQPHHYLASVVKLMISTGTHILEVENVSPFFLQET